MYSMTHLSGKIAAVQAQNLSGVLMVSGRFAASQTKTLTYSLRFESGDLARIGGATDATGIDAFVELVQLQNLNEPHWFPLNATPNWTAQPQITRQEMAGLLNLASTAIPGATNTTTLTPSGMASTAHTEQAGKALMQRVRNVFTNVYIGDTDRDLARIAKLHPPSTEPAAFINSCVQLLEPMLGDEAARSLLSA